jgi:DNA topoisomerase-1
MEIKLGRNGKFLSCSRYPECDGALTLDGMEFKKDEPIGTDPATGLPIFVLNGRFGPYVQLGVKPPKIKKAKKPRVKKEKKKKLKKGEIEVVEDLAAAKAEPVVEIPAPIKPKMASIPKTIDPSKITVEQALKYLSLPRTLGIDPKTGAEIKASAGRFGPYIVRDGEYRSVKAPDDVYEITLARALELLAIEKKKRGFQKKKKAE